MADITPDPWLFPSDPGLHSYLNPSYKGFYIEKLEDESKNNSILLTWVDQEGKQKKIEIKKMDPITSTVIDLDSPVYRSSGKLDPESQRSTFGFSLRIFWAFHNF